MWMGDAVTGFIIIPVKTCALCRKPKHESYMKGNYCIECTNKRNAERELKKYYRNIDDSRKKRRDYYRKNSATILKKQRDYLQKNPDIKAKRRTAGKQYNKKMREWRRQYGTEWYRRNKSKYKGYRDKKVQTLTDGYVRQLICESIKKTGTIISAKDIPPALVELKREQIRLHRAIEAKSK
jgi:hypothetical protein